MITTKKVANNLEANYEELLENPVKWALMRNIALASIRDEYINEIKYINENAADTHIIANVLNQKLTSQKTNQYIEANKVFQEINITDLGQLYQIMMNTDLFQVINLISRKEITNSVVKMIRSDLTLFFKHKYATIIYDYSKNYYHNYSSSNLSLLKKYIHDNIIKEHEILEEFYDLTDNKNKYKTSSYTYGSEYTYKKKVVTTYQDKIFDSKKVYAIYEVIKDFDTFIILIVNLEKLNKKNKEEEKKHILENNLFGQSISSYEKMKNFIGESYSEEIYNKNIGGLMETIDNLEKNKKFNTNVLSGNKKSVKDFLFGFPIKSNEYINMMKEKKVKTTKDILIETKYDERMKDPEVYTIYRDLEEEHRKKKDEIIIAEKEEISSDELSGIFDFETQNNDIEEDKNDYTQGIEVFKNVKPKIKKENPKLLKKEIDLFREEHKTPPKKQPTKSQVVNIFKKLQKKKDNK